MSYYKTYIIKVEETTLYKIGRSSRPAERLKQLQSGQPHELKLIGVFKVDLENKLHSQFYEYRKRGEWFDIPPRLIEKVLTEFKHLIIEI